MGEAKKVEKILILADLACGMVGKKRVKLLLSIFKRYWPFLILLDATVPDFPQRVEELLEKSKKEKKI